MRFIEIRGGGGDGVERVDDGLSVRIDDIIPIEIGLERER